jgi:hypothetical protein
MHTYLAKQHATIDQLLVAEHIISLELLAVENQALVRLMSSCGFPNLSLEHVACGRCGYTHGHLLLVGEADLCVCMCVYMHVCMYVYEC